MCLGVVFLFLSGCAVGPDYQRPDIAVPDGWGETSGLRSGDPNSLARWWEKLNDPILNELIDRAGQYNPDIYQSYLRILQSRAQRNYTAGIYEPQVDAVANYQRSRDSGRNYQASLGQLPEDVDTYTAGFEAAWEIDFFGRIKRSVEAANYEFEASVEDYRNVMISIYSEVTRNYIEVRTAQRRLKYALDNIRTQRETLELTKARFESGLVPELDVEQARANLANTESEVPLLREAETAAVNRIAVLLGTYPQQLGIDLYEQGEIPDVTAKPVGIAPMELLRRRPDVRAAERRLAAQTARIGIAKADLYPSLSITGYFKFEAMDFDDLGDWAARKYGFGPGFQWNILNGDRIRSNIRIQEIERDRAFIEYKKTVLYAVEEAEDAISFYARQGMRYEALKRSVDASEKSVELVRTLYTNGLTDFQNVLDTQRTLFLQQDRLAASRGQIAQDWVGIYKAFGGGWEIKPGQPKNQE